MSSSRRAALVLAALSLAVLLLMLVAGLQSIRTFGPNPTMTRLATPTAAAIGTQSGSALDQVDAQLRQMMAGSLAYNAPSSMQLDEARTIQLLMSPSLSPDQLATQLSESGTVITATVNVTPRMRAELRSADPQAFVIQALHADAEQLLSTTEPTEWRWTITARKDGLQDLTLTVYRLVEYNGKDYWREVSYKHDIQVQVTILQRLQQLNWEWLVGLAATGLLIPAIWRWIDQRQQKQPKRKR
jgi:hypothetical protein